MPTDAAPRPLPVNLLVRLVFGVREAVLDRPLARAVLRAAGWPLIKLMHLVAGRGPQSTPVPAPDQWGEPVLRLPLDYVPGALTPAPRIGVLLHAFHVDLLDEMARYLRRIPFPTDLFVSTDTEAKRKTIAAAFAGWTGGAVEVRIAPNRGRNVAPQLVTFRDVYDSHPFVLFVHTKTSSHTEELAGWREFLLNNLLGSQAMVRGVIEAFVQVPGLGVLAPRTYGAVRPHMVWTDNFDACRALAERMGLALYPDSPLDFPAGFMFWARSAALQPLLDLGLGYDDFDEEAGQKDGTLAHAVERLVFHACELAGLRWAKAGSGADLRAPEIPIRAEIPRQLQRLVTDAGRTLALPGRPPHPALTPDAPPPPPPEARKLAFREQCARELDAFLAGGERLALPVSETPEVSIVLVLFNQAELTYQCLRSLRFAQAPPFELIVVDNASSDRTGELLDRLDGARIVRNTQNLHFLLGVNQAAELARGRAILLLNNDARVRPGAIGAALRTLDSEADIGAVGGPIELLDGTLQEAGSIIWSDGACLGYGRGEDPADPEFQFRRDVDYCSGAFLIVRRELFEQLGRFDVAFAPAYYEETDLCMRIREAGLRVVYEPAAHVTHFEFGSASSSQAALELQRKHRRLFARRHAQALRTGHRAPGSRPLEARMRGAGRGRVLVVEDQVPYPQLGAGYPRARDLLRAVAADGGFVTFYPLVFADVDYAQAYRLLAPDMEIAAERGEAGLAAFMAERAGYYDAVIVSRPHNMEVFRRALAQAPGFIALDRVIYDAEAIFALRDQARDASGRAAAAEVALARGTGAVLAVSEAEARAFREAGCADVRVLGHALEPRPTPATFDERGDLLFVGALDEDLSPNADSLAFFVGEVMPRLDALIGTDYALRVAGRCGSARVRALAGDRVQLLGQVADLRPLYERSRLFIAPTRHAAGIPMKVHEAAAAGLPVAATGLLAGQLGWADGVELSVGDDPQAFAEACARAYRDPAVWTRLRAGALRRIETDCDPDAFAASVAAVLAAVRGRLGPIS